MELYDLKYSLSAFAVMSLVVFIGFLPWVVHWCKQRENFRIGLIEASCISVVITVIFLAAVGIILYLAPHSIRHAISLSTIIATILLGGLKTVSLLKNKRKVFPTALETTTISGFLLFGTMILILTSIKFPLKDNLPDGAYVNKEHVSSVKIQSITGNLPADNVVPFVAEEYLAKNISFKENSPILPGQHVANRPILVSLVTLPIRLTFRSPKPVERLPTYEYVSTQWPDFRILLRDEAAFSIFLGVGVFLNACLFLGIGLMATKIKNISWHSSALLFFLFSTSPYFIFQTFFTWPKSLAGFFIIAAIFAFQKYKNGVLTGLLLALAYLSHPYSIGYLIAATTIFFLLDKSQSYYKRLVDSALIVISFAIFVSPWFLWIKFFVGGASDLISQNFTTSEMSVFQFFWPRIANLMNTVIPTHILSYETHLTTLYVNSSLNLSGAVGSLFFAIFLSTAVVLVVSAKNIQKNYLIRLTPSDLSFSVWICGAASFLLACVFSNPAVPVVHGWQPFAALILVLGVNWAVTSKIALAFCWIQVLINITMATIYFYRRYLISD